MRFHSKLRQSALSSIVAVAMVGSLSFAPALASAQQESQDLTIGTISSGLPEWAIDDGEDAQKGGLTAQAAIPNKYDLRSDGLVTPVKFQNPWGSCWAFGGTAAAETSILSAYGSTYEESGLDLSERHLTYFALQPVSEAVNTDQVGEGLHAIAQEDKGDENAAFDAGGQPIYITTLFSQGIGPMLESLYPYRGNNAITSMDDYNQDPERATKEMLLGQFHSEAAVDAFIAQQAQAKGISVDEEFQELVVQIGSYIENSPTYSKNDEWFIPETNADGTSNRLVSNGMVLKNGNVLPAYWTGGETPSDTGVNAIKQEILNGRGVSIGFYCEQGATYATSPSETNNDQAQYVFDAQPMTHGVCIVGWDDSYAKENFSHELKVAQPDGTVVDRTAETTPPGDGAWIVKNSYGSETDYSTDDLGNTVNKSKWGTLNDEGKSTGYFYLSYYDRTIQQAESMEFAADLGAAGGFLPLQHDYMPANGGFYTTPETTGDDVTSSANVFDADTDIVVKSVSTRTSETNARVTLAIYELHDDFTNPTDGDMLYRTSRNFEYGGFHRLNLDQPITIEAGKKFSVVSTMSTVDSAGARHYSATANQGLSKELVTTYMESMGREAKCYSTAVINEGESFLYKDGKWQDWKAYTDALPLSEEAKPYAPSAEKYVDAYPIDNFSIKVYAEPVDNSQGASAAITSQPEDCSAAIGSTFSFAVAASGGAESYRWQQSKDGGESWRDVPGDVGASAELSYGPMSASLDGRMFRCRVAFAGGVELVSNAATLTVSPKITTDPQDATVAAGKTATFSVEAAGEGLSYQWYFSANGGKSWKSAGSSDATLSFKAKAKFDGYQLKCLVTDADGNRAISDAATLTISPKIASQPQDATVAEGKTARFSVEAAGDGLAYRWYFSADGGGTWKKTSATGATLALKATADRDGYQFRCVVADEHGSRVVSEAASLAVYPRVAA